MMFTSPRIIAIDDELDHLAGLGNSLNRNNIACLQIPFRNEETDIKPCPDVRVIFADLNLGGGALGPDPKTDFAVIGSILEKGIKPSGPYFIILWTKYTKEANNLQTFLEERLKGVTKPFDVLPLDKSNHLDGEGNVRDEEKLMQEIETLTEKLPQVGALFNWESRVVGATGSTVSSLLELASTKETNTRAEEVGRILTRLGIEAVGKDHVGSDRFRSVNEALLPILADQIANLRSNESDDEIWRSALEVSGSHGISLQEAARLNRMAHISDSESPDGSERGCVIPLPDSFRGKFEDTFNINEKDAAKNQFLCKEFTFEDERFHWVLVQIQAACDYAQTQPGPLPFYLGLDLPEDQAHKNRKAPASLWTSPAFELDEEIRLLHVNARFPLSLAPDQARTAAPRYRLREQILNDLIHCLHSHGARPGMISFRARK